MSGDDDKLFEEAMASLDVTDGLEGLGVDDALLTQRLGTRSLLLEASQREARAGHAAEDHVFLSAMGALHEVPEEKSPAAARAPQAQPSRARLIRRGEMVADVRLDLHGHTEAQAWTALEACILEARRRGHRVLLVICGQGLHSKKGAVLRAALQTWLGGPLREHVAEHSPAAPKQGGRGAWWLFLRP
ncbi:MAG: Smr/MutS family protein [Myxococcota bacterium]